MSGDNHFSNLLNDQNHFGTDLTNENYPTFLSQQQNQPNEQPPTSQPFITTSPTHIIRDAAEDDKPLWNQFSLSTPTSPTASYSKAIQQPRRRSASASEPTVEFQKYFSQDYTFFQPQSLSRIPNVERFSLRSTFEPPQNSQNSQLNQIPLTSSSSILSSSVSHSIPSSPGNQNMKKLAAVGAPQISVPNAQQIPIDYTSPLMTNKGSLVASPHKKKNVNSHSSHSSQSSQQTQQPCLEFQQHKFCLFKADCMFSHETSSISKTTSSLAPTELYRAFIQYNLRSNHPLPNFHPSPFYVFSSKLAALRQLAGNFRNLSESLSLSMSLVVKGIIIEANSLLDDMLLHVSHLFPFSEQVLPKPILGRQPDQHFLDSCRTAATHIVQHEQLLSIPELKKLETIRFIRDRLVSSSSYRVTAQTARRCVTTIESFLRNNTFRNLLDPRVYQNRKPKCNLTNHSKYCRGPVKKYAYHQESKPMSCQWWDLHVTPIPDVQQFTQDFVCPIDFYCICCHSLLIKGSQVHCFSNNSLWSKFGAKLANIELLNGQDWNCPWKLFHHGLGQKRVAGPSQRLRCATCKAVVGRFFKRMRQHQLVYISPQTGCNFLYFQGNPSTLQLVTGSKAEETRFLPFVHNNQYGVLEIQIYHHFLTHPNHPTYIMPDNPEFAIQMISTLLHTDGQFLEYVKTFFDISSASYKTVDRTKNKGSPSPSSSTKSSPDNRKRQKITDRQILPPDFSLNFSAPSSFGSTPQNTPTSSTKSAVS